MINIKHRKILSLLVNNEGQRFSRLKKKFADEDKFPYHLGYLKDKSCIKKEANKYYTTPKRAHMLKHFDSKTLETVDTKTPVFVLTFRTGDEYLLRKHHNLYSLWPHMLKGGKIY